MTQFCFCKQKHFSHRNDLERSLKVFSPYHRSLHVMYVRAIWKLTFYLLFRN